MNAWFFIFYGEQSKEKAMPSGIASQKRKGKMNIIFQESSIRFPIEYRAFPVR